MEREAGEREGGDEGVVEMGGAESEEIKRLGETGTTGDCCWPDFYSVSITRANWAVKAAVFSMHSRTA